MKDGIIARCRVFFPSVVLIIILIGFQLLIFVQISSCIEPTNSVYVGQTLSKFTNIHRQNFYNTPSRASTSLIHDDISSAYNTSLEIFLNKEFRDNSSLPPSANIRNLSRNISKANDVSLEIFLNKKIKPDIASTHGSGEPNNVGRDASINIDLEENITGAVENSTDIIKRYVNSTRSAHEQAQYN